MGERAREAGSERQTAASPARAAVPPTAANAAAARALALQRAAGNRAATRLLTRWAAHPDKDKKGVLMPDAMAAEFVRFNPPLSK